VSGDHLAVLHALPRGLRAPRKGWQELVSKEKALVAEQRAKLFEGFIPLADGRRGLSEDKGHHQLD